MTPPAAAVSEAVSEADWEQIFSLADAGKGRSPDTYLEELRSQGVAPRLLEKIALQLEIGEPPQRPDRHRRGERIGAHIELRGHLREGGAGSVYLASYEKDGRVVPVAVKLLRVSGGAAARAEIKQAWEEERRLLREFSDTGTVSPLVEAGEHRHGGETSVYLCTEYKHGSSLTSWAEQHALNVRERLELWGQACDAVATIHAHGLVHGDLKPDNVQVERREGTTRVWLLDLGLVAVQGTRWHGQDELVGTPGYMSPEQISDRYGPVTEASDIYALGLMLFELLEGRPWLEVRGATTLASLHTLMAQSPPVRLTRIDSPPLCAQLQSLLDRATAYRPPDRFAKVSVLRAALDRILADTAPAEAVRRAAPGPRLPESQPAKPAPRGGSPWRWRRGLVFAGIAGLLAGVPWIWTGFTSAQRESETATPPSVGRTAPVQADARSGSRPERPSRTRPEVRTRATAGAAGSGAGGLEFAWPGPDCWEIYRDELRVASSCGAGSQALQPGTYTVKARSSAVFEPFEIHISAGATETVALGGVLDFAWPGPDCWEIYRAELRVASSCGASKQALQPGIYTVKARSGAVFEPFAVHISAGATETAAFGGVLEFTWPGSDCWEVYRDERRVSSSCGAGKQALQAGIYTVKARSSLVFEPFEVTITDGESTVAP